MQQDSPHQAQCLHLGHPGLQNYKKQTHFYESPVSAIPLYNKGSQEIGTIGADVAVTNVKTVNAAVEPGDELEAGPVLKGMLGCELCHHRGELGRCCWGLREKKPLFCFEKEPLPEPRAHQLVILDSQRALRTPCFPDSTSPTHLNTRIRDEHHLLAFLM